jgi:Flp pilus assembly pilin Flp
MYLLQMLPPAVLAFLKCQSGASIYEYALVASLVAVIGVIVLVALGVGS